MIMYDPVYVYTDSVEKWMKRRDNRLFFGFSSFFSKYFIGDYNNFIEIRKRELKLQDNFLFKIKKHFSLTFSFNKNEEIWYDLKIIMKQTKIFTDLDKFNINKNDTFFCINEKKFNLIKSIWEKYINCLIEKNEKLRIQSKVNNF